MTLRVLVIDAEPSTGSSFRDVLGEAGCESVWVERGEEAMRLLERTPFDVVVTALDLDGGGGLEICRGVAARKPWLPVVVRGESITTARAVELMRAGAREFVSGSEPERALLDAMTRVVTAARTALSRLPRDEGEALRSMEEVERLHVTRVLEAVGGNKREAARILKLDRTTLYRKLKRYGIESRRRSAAPASPESPPVDTEDAPREQAMG